MTSRSGSAVWPDSARLASVHDALLSWFRQGGRDLPWRRTRDPYAVLVSEIMLQQTQVDRVRPKYTEFLAAYPTLADLAAAPLGDVIRCWAPLGYNRRAVRLHAIARTVVQRFGGRLPDQVEELYELDGLGKYTASAVACFAFERAVAVVETNVRRVVSRLFADLLGDPPQSRPSLEAFAARLLPPGRAYEWNQALMDLGATICTARAPACIACPLAVQCSARSLLASGAARMAERRARYGDSPRFEQTRRYFRGRIVDRLRALGPAESVSLDELGGSLRPDFGPELGPWLVELVEGLRRDRLVVESRGRVRLP